MALLGVKAGCQPRLIHIIVAVANVAHAMGLSFEVLLTAGINGDHAEHSLHYALRALDVRSKNFPDDGLKDQFLDALKTALGPDYDVLLEQRGLPNEHVHLEFDP